MSPSSKGREKLTLGLHLQCQSCSWDGRTSWVARNGSHHLSQELDTGPWEDSTNDISHYLGMLDPWYERNVLGLMNLPPEVLCQVSGHRVGLESLLTAVTLPHLESTGFGGTLLEASFGEKPGG